MQNITSEWKYYNHALIPTCAPHETPDFSVIEDGSAWKNGRGTIFARWTSEYDNNAYTDGWYIVQDSPYELENQKKSHRRKIKKGLSNFECKIINPSEHAARMAEITLLAWSKYPAKYRPKFTKEQLMKSYCKVKESNLVFGCFNHDGLLCGFDYVEDCGNYWVLGQGKTDPEFERGFELNAAMTYSETQFLKEDIKRGKYLTNGQRNILHETNFNEDLCHYYGFRKAYCKLMITYNPKYRWIISIMYPLRKIISKLSRLRLFNNLYHILEMEAIVRKQREI